MERSNVFGLTRNSRILLYCAFLTILAYIGFVFAIGNKMFLIQVPIIILPLLPSLRRYELTDKGLSVYPLIYPRSKRIISYDDIFNLTPYYNKKGVLKGLKVDYEISTPNAKNACQKSWMNIGNNIDVVSLYNELQKRIPA